MRHEFLIKMAILTVVLVLSCTQVSNENKSASEGITYAKGQSAVEDESVVPNVLQIAIGSEDHTTLVAAVQATELEDVLVNAGPLTVFAPNNAAFDALPEGTLETLLQPENKGVLARIIKFHAAPGNYQGDLLKDNMRLFMASGHYIPVKREGESVMIGEAKVLGTVQASNGVVHVIDQVLLPPDQ